MNPTNNNRYRELKVAGEFLYRDCRMTRSKRLNFPVVVPNKTILHHVRAKRNAKDQEAASLLFNTSISHSITSSVVASKLSPNPLV